MNDKKSEFARGTTVTITGMPGKYEVADGPNKKGELYLVRGALGVWAAPEKLKPASADFSALRNLKSIRRRNQDGEKRERIDLHAMSVNDALVLLERQLGAALINGTTVLEVVHGFGSGKIRTAVQRYLGGSKHVARFELDPANQGVTLAYLA